MTPTASYYHDRRGAIDLASRVASSAVRADQIRCEWQLTNNGDAAMAVSFYVRTIPARLLALACSSDRIVCGHFHGSAVIRIPGKELRTISALLELVAPGDNEVRVGVVTRYETFTRIDVVTTDHD